MKTILVDGADTFTVGDDSGKFVISSELFELLEKYPNKKIIVTNANDEQIPLFGMDNVPYELFTLKHKPNKPDPVYFKTLLDKYGLKAEEVIYFEHSVEAVGSAKSIGISSYFFDHVERDLEALKTFIDSSL